MIELPQSQVLVVGAGIAGLMIAHRLAQYGLNPTVIECSEKVAAGPTIRNQGWLHAGTIHSQSIADPALSIRVAQRCMYGHAYFRNFCPEAIENPITPTLAVTFDERRIPEIVDRWEEAGVVFRPLTTTALERRCPPIVRRNVAASWIVNDLTVNSRVICSRLVAAIQREGGHVLCRSRIERLAMGDTTVESYGIRHRLFPMFIVIAAGYWTNEILQAHWGMSIPLRFWKSHLLVTNRVEGAAVFAVDDGEAGIVHHGRRSVAGMTGDNLPISEPSNEVVLAESEKIGAALARLVHLPQDAMLVPYACTKVDVVDESIGVRNLDVQVKKIAEHVLSVFPGKMTEAPFLADMIVKEVIEALDAVVTTDRPIDTVEIESKFAIALPSRSLRQRVPASD
jgi:glycine/D-amino acid oxidase-like deaminating enzyme